MASGQTITDSSTRHPPELPASQLVREVPAGLGFRTFVLADPLYAFIHRTEKAKSLARVIAPGAQIFGGGTGIAQQFFEEVDHALELDVPGVTELAEAFLSGGALFMLASYTLDPTSHAVGDWRLPHSVEHERLRLLWHERVWQGLNLTSPSTWSEIVDCIESVTSENLVSLRRASKKTESYTRAADLLSKTFAERNWPIDSERLIVTAFPETLHGPLRDLRDATRPSAAEIDAIVAAAAELGPWPTGLDLAELSSRCHRPEEVNQKIRHWMSAGRMGRLPSA